MADELVRRFARAHGCPPGCPDCARAEAARGVPERLSEWEEFVASGDALRLVVQCKRSRRPLPTLSPDDVVQFCIEEALFDRLTLQEHQESARSFQVPESFEGEPGAVSAGTNHEHDAALAQARAFASGRSA